MKKKIIFAIATVFFAVATVFNMNVLQGNSAGDVSLDAIAVMAQAWGEINPECPNGCFITPGWCYCYGLRNNEEAYSYWN
ncbi:hypothetical protein [Natronoflexus pectinivorans]|uniref:NVEALA protein n=1 Tax=Natronoflexus pectinivorans TaxID=682526 RepID=A0A4R2GGI2_9BACT|nr:hypothetical protein [Natronoflexus pectinivorans]TCO07334.1 hypothetical protein EV194_109153 [Natronoflexus pectinivorans]